MRGLCISMAHFYPPKKTLCLQNKTKQKASFTKKPHQVGGGKEKSVGKNKKTTARTKTSNKKVQGYPIFFFFSIKLFCAEILIIITQIICFFARPLFGWESRDTANMEFSTQFIEPSTFPRTETPRKSVQQEWLVIVILLMICVLAFSVRLFAVVRFESIIHEFDPQFNFRATRVLAEKGMEGFTNWFDERVWYPLGRWVGHTVYPGLMATSAFLHYSLNLVSLGADLRNICVFFGPVFAAFSALLTFKITKDSFDEGAAIVAAAFIAIV